MRIAGTFWTKTLTPMILETLGRRPRITSSADLRWERGFKVMVARPTLSDGLNEVAPKKPVTASMLGSARRISSTERWYVTMASNEVSWGASMKQKSCPASSLGRKPLGIFEYSAAVATTTTRNTAMTSLWRPSNHIRLDP